MGLGNSICSVLQAGAFLVGVASAAGNVEVGKSNNQNTSALFLVDVPHATFTVCLCASCQKQLVAGMVAGLWMSVSVVHKTPPVKKKIPKVVC